MSAIADRLAEVRSRIAGAARRSGRSPADVTLVAVSKTFEADRVREAYAAGQREFGENKVQEGLQKSAATADIPIAWHLIGHVQSNKAKKAAVAFAWIQSVDSIDLLERLDAAAAERPAASGTLEVLVQIDLAGEATKFGAPPDEAERIVRAALEARHVRLSGLMLLPPWSADPEESRPWFARVRQFRDRLVDEGVPAASLRHLSMGMSHDYEAAIEEGSTIVRVGTAIFGARPPTHRAPE
ncbi:MAG TPA: YggS family pyridoxal phosphate-dependent enzyme [Vicinamibacterales bacterium]